MTEYEPGLQSEIEFSDLIQSSRRKNVKYLYPRIKTTKITIQSPKLLIKAHRSENNDTQNLIDVDISPSKVSENQTQESENFHESLSSLVTFIGNFLKTKDYILQFDRNTLTLNVCRSGNNRSIFYSAKQRAEIQDLDNLKNNDLSGKLCKIIAELSGVVLVSSSKTARLVWGIDQMLVFDHLTSNPFGQKYEFVEDDGYVSLED